MEKKSIAELSKGYAELCQKAGHLQYQIHAISKDLELVNEQLRELNLEAAAVQKAEQDAKDSAAAPVVSSAV